MKILSQGQIPEPPTPEWVGIELVCQSCQCSFQLEAGDSVDTWADRGYTIPDSGISVACPCCKRSIGYSFKSKAQVPVLDIKTLRERFDEAVKRTTRPTERPFYPPPPNFDRYPQPPAPYLDPTTRPMCETGDPLPERGYTTSP